MVSPGEKDRFERLKAEETGHRGDHHLVVGGETSHTLRVGQIRYDYVDIGLCLKLVQRLGIAVDDRHRGPIIRSQVASHGGADAAGAKDDDIHDSTGFNQVRTFSPPESWAYLRLRRPLVSRAGSRAN